MYSRFADSFPNLTYDEPMAANYFVSEESYYRSFRALVTDSQTLADKLEKKRLIRPSGPVVPQHNNRKNKPNKRGKRSRYVQYTPSGKAIYHEVPKK